MSQRVKTIVEIMASRKIGFRDACLYLHYNYRTIWRRANDVERKALAYAERYSRESIRDELM